MQNYALYKIIFSKNNQKELFDEDKNRKQIDEALTQLETILNGDLLFIRKTKREEEDYDRLEHSIEARRDHVVLMMLKNNKRKRYMEGREERDLKYHPGCYIIFDLRQGVAQVAIERISAFDNEPDRVNKILTQTLNNALQPFGLCLEIRPKMREGKFWEVIDEQRNVFQDEVKSIVFELPKKNAMGPTDKSYQDSYNQEQNANFKGFMAYARKEKKCKFAWYGDEDDPVKLDHLDEDVAVLVGFCCSNGYAMHVRFNNYGLYRFGDKIRAYEQLDDKIVTAFIVGQEEMFGQKWSLFIWLDKARQRSQNLEESKNLRNETTECPTEIEA